MKADYVVSSAKSMITRNKGHFEGKMIIIEQPGIKVLGAIDYLTAHGYSWNKYPEPKKFKPRKRKEPDIQQLLRLGVVAMMLREGD